MQNARRGRAAPGCRRRGSRGGAPGPPPPPRALTFLEAGALPSPGGRSPEHVRGGCGAVRGTRSQALQRAAPPSPGSAPLRGRCHLVLAAERKRRDTLPRPRRLLLWLLSAGPVSLIFLPGIWVGSVGGGDGGVRGQPGASDCGAYGRRGVRRPRRAGPMPDAPAERGGEGRQPGGEGCGAAARAARVAARPAVVTRQLPAAAPVPGPSSSAPAGLRRLRSATARPAAQRAEPRRPRSAPLRPRRPRSPSPARPLAAAPWALRARPAAGLAPPHPLPPRQTPAAVPNLTFPGPTPPKIGILKNPLTPKESMKKRKQGFHRPLETL